MAEMAAALGISLSTLRRMLRPGPRVASIAEDVPGERAASARERRIHEKAEAARAVRDAQTRALWADRLQLQQRKRGASLPVHHASKARFLEWAPVLRSEDPPVSA
jgi:hypothetical protein